MSVTSGAEATPQDFDLDQKFTLERGRGWMTRLLDADR